MPASPVPDGGNTTLLEKIVVKGQALKRADTGFSTTTIDNVEILEYRAVEVEELFRKVPGMNVRDYGLGGVGNQIVLRGFGNGGHGGDIGFVVDGVPLNEANSHADGYVDLHVLIPLEIANLTVYRGPVSALYGNFNRGGLVAFETRKSGDYAEADVSAAAYGTLDAQVAFGAPLANGNQVNFAAQAYHTDGFRPQSDTDRATVSGRYSGAISPDLDFAISTRLQNAQANSAAYLTPAQFAVDPYGIDPRAQNDGTKKNFGTLRGDLNYTISPEARLLSFAYTTQQDFTRYFSRGSINPAVPWNQREETYDRNVYGLGTSLNGIATLANREIDYVLGVEGFEESTEFQFYDGLNRRMRVGPALNDRESTIRSTSAFGEATMAINPALDLQLGFRADRLSGDCRKLGPEAGSDPCADLDAVSAVTPKFGLQFQALDWLRLRTSYAEGFALPEGFTKYAPGVQSLDPNRFSQWEVGARAVLGAFEFDIAAYRARSSEEFRTVVPGEFENFGATRRRGVEGSVTWRPVDAFSLQAVYGYADSEILQNADVALLGNRVAGVPVNTGTLIASWYASDALRLDATVRHTGAYWKDGANTAQTDSYQVVDLGASYAFATLRPIRLYADIDNVGDKVYAASAGLTTIAAGAPRTFRIGVQVGF